MVRRSHPSGLLARPEVRALVAASALARLPFGMGAVALVIFVHSRTGSFGASGAITATYTLSFAVGGPILGRLVDRRGPRSVVLPAAAVSAAATAGVVALGEIAAPIVALAVLAGVAGAATPPVSGVLRRVWPNLVSAEDLPRAYLLDSILIEAIFIGGQVITAVLAVAIDPAAPLAFAACVGIAGAAWFVSRPEVAGPERRREERRGRAGAMASPTIRLLVVTGVPVGFTFGALDVALPAFGAEHGSSAMGGLFTALIGVGSVVGALLYGAYPARLGDLRQACLRLAVAQPLLGLPLLLVSSPTAMVVPVIVAGTYAAPILTVRSRIAQISMPAGTGTEAFTWLLLSVMAGISAGSLISGPLIEASGWRLGVVAAIAGPTAMLPILVAGRGLLTRG